MDGWVTEWYDRFRDRLKPFGANLSFRRELIERAAVDDVFREELWCACSRDPLFYWNAFHWTLNPRLRGEKRVPFITYPYQDEAMVSLLRAMPSRDQVWEKTRDMGGTICVLAVLEWVWHFRDHYQFLVGSRKQELVDKRGDHKTLFAKVDFMLEHLPGWLVPRHTRKELHLSNDETGSVIDGESTNQDFARGDRRTVIMLDEFASVESPDAIDRATADATDCRVFISTPKGRNKFYALRNQPGMEVITLHWSKHPVKARGLYYDENGKPRSPWYDREVARRGSLRDVAQELDIDYAGSEDVFFDAMALEKARCYVLDPEARGDLDFDVDTLIVNEFVETDNGPLAVWGWPEEGGQYVIGGDIAAGTRVGGRGASNSCLSVVDRDSGEKVAEYVVNGVQPHELAKTAVALAKWYNGAFLIWEANGPGKAFGDNVLDLGWGRIYFRQNERSIGHEVSTTPGWWSTREAKYTLLSEYRRALGTGAFRNHSQQALLECEEYVFIAGGAVAHAGSVATEDPSEARDNHGDRVIADAVAWRAVKETSYTEEPEEEEPEFCYASRQRAARQKRRVANGGWVN
ncbi:MAG: hypothetical protein JXA57_15230 [Armatimonadetes bacterium]|nr:hypothetical protein [Armatimonadota bacterium]